MADMSQLRAPDDNQMAWLAQHFPGVHMHYVESTVKRNCHGKPVALHCFDVSDWFPRIPYEELKKMQRSPILDKEAARRKVSYHGTGLHACMGSLAKKSLLPRWPSGPGNPD